MIDFPGKRFLRLCYDHSKRLMAHRTWPATGKVLLHLGCGKVNDPHFINIDSHPLPHAHYVRDMCSPKMWKQNDADMIYVSHALEHVPRKEVIGVLKNWHSFLKPDGVLRISVPDYDGIHRIYELQDRNILCVDYVLMGGQHHEFDFHYSVFNKKYLTDLLLEAGFSTIRDWDPEDCEFHGFQDCANFNFVHESEKIWWSVNIEAIK